MKLKRSAFLTIGPILAVLALGLGGCAADRHKEVKSAETTLTSARQEAYQDAVRLRDKQARELAQAQKDKLTTAERAELTAKQIEERAETTAEGTKKIAEAEAEVTAARAEMRKERVTAEADAKARLQKADARFLAAHGKSASLTGKDRARYDDNVHLYAVKRAEAEQKISELVKSPDDRFERAKDEVDDTLDELERFADRINDDI